MKEISASSISEQETKQQLNHNLENSDLEFAKEDSRIVAHQEVLSVGITGIYEEDDSSTIFREMVQREAQPNEQ